MSAVTSSLQASASLPRWYNPAALLGSFSLALASMTLSGFEDEAGNLNLAAVIVIGYLLYMAITFVVSRAVE